MINLDEKERNFRKKKEKMVNRFQIQVDQNRRKTEILAKIKKEQLMFVEQFPNLNMKVNMLILEHRVLVSKNISSAVKMCLIKIKNNYKHFLLNLQNKFKKNQETLTKSQHLSEKIQQLWQSIQSQHNTHKTKIIQLKDNIVQFSKDILIEYQIDNKNIQYQYSYHQLQQRQSHLLQIQGKLFKVFDTIKNQEYFDILNRSFTQNDKKKQIGQTFEITMMTAQKVQQQIEKSHLIKAQLISLINSHIKKINQLVK